MPKLEIDISDDGKIEKVPEPVQKLIDKAFGQGQAKAADEGQKAAKALQTEIDELKKGGLSPAEREKLKTLEADQSKLKEELALRDKNFEEAQRIRNERHQKELDDRDAKLTASQAEIAKRTERIQQLVVTDIRAAALAAGARKESVAELEFILGAQVGLDDGLQPFVRDTKEPGKARLDDKGQPLTIEGLVGSYLADHPHHKAGTPGRGGGAGGGRSFNGSTGGAHTEKAAALAEVERRPTVQNVAAAMSLVGKSK